MDDFDYVVANFREYFATQNCELGYAEARDLKSHLGLARLGRRRRVPF